MSIRRFLLTGVVLTALLTVVLAAVAVRPGSDRRAGATDFDVAVLEGTVRMGGVPLDSRFSGAECGLKVQAVQGGTLIGSAQLTGSGTYSFPALQAGSFDLYLASSKSDTPATDNAEELRKARSERYEAIKTMIEDLDKVCAETRKIIYDLRNLMRQ